MSHPTVLYAEDDPGDALLMRHAWTKAGLVNSLRVVDDGEEAQRYLSGEGRYASRIDHPMPRLVLLDLKMPKRSGLDVLIWIRAQPALHDLPVILFSSSTHRVDIEAANALGVNAYLVKPSRLDEWMAMLANLHGTWLEGG